MRKGFNGPYGLARDQLSCDPLSGHLFLFSNAQHNLLKILFWDTSGLWVCAKKLEKGRFHWPESDAAQNKIVLSHEELALLQLLEENLRLERIAKYGPGSEKLTSQQLELLELEPGISSDEVQAESEREPLPSNQKKRKHPGRQALPSACASAAVLRLR